MITEEVLLTPTVAKHLIEKNKMNRNISEDWVYFLSREMQLGNWKVNGDTIVIDTDGYVMDGQHRLHAVIDAKYEYPALIVSDVEPGARPTIDDVRVRRFSDDLAMTGHVNTVNTEALLRKIVRWNTRQGFASKMPRLSRSYLTQIYPQYKKVMEEAHEFTAGRFTRIPVPRNTLEFMWWLLTQNAPKELVGKYFSILAIGSQDSLDDVLIRLNNKLRQLYDEYNPTVKSAKTAQAIYYMIIGWNAWVNGESTRFALPRGGLSDPYPGIVAVAK